MDQRITALFSAPCCRSGVIIVTFYVIFQCEAVGVLVLWQEPLIGAVSPSFGPRAGGTRLSVRGRHLDIGSQLLVYAASRPCTIIRCSQTCF